MMLTARREEGGTGRISGGATTNDARPHEGRLNATERRTDERMTDDGARKTSGRDVAAGRTLERVRSASATARGWIAKTRRRDARVGTTGWRPCGASCAVIARWMDGSRCEPAVVLALQQMQLQLHVTPLEETLFFTATPSHRRSRRTRDASPSTPHRRPRPASAPRRAAHRVVRSAPHRRDGAVRHVHRGQEHGPAVSDGGRAAEDGPSRPRRGRRHHGHHVVRDADAGVSDQETGARAPGGARRRLARRVESSRRAFARRFRARVET